MTSCLTRGTRPTAHNSPSCWDGLQLVSLRGSCVDLRDSSLTTAAWASFWFMYDGLVFTSAIFAGIIVFQKTDQQMYAEA